MVAYDSCICYNLIGDEYMKCENYFCIYEENGFCRLDSVELDIQGQCKEGIYLNIDEKTLKSLKDKTITE